MLPAVKRKYQEWMKTPRGVSTGEQLSPLLSRWAEPRATVN